MDRRDFLKVGGAAAVAAGATTTPAPAAPAILPDATELHLSTPGLPDLPGFGPDRLARRIEAATGGRFRIVSGAQAANSELVFGAAHAQRGRHAAFAFFAGLPLGQGLDAAAQQTWLAVGGGQMLWDDLAAQFGFKPLLAGHTGPSGGLWSVRRVETASDLAGARLHVEGLAADVVRRLGAMPVQLEAADVRAALADGRLDGAEWLGPLMAVAPDLQPLAGRLYHPGLNAAGAMLSLDVRSDAWARLNPGDQAIFEACTAEAYQLSLAEAHAHQLMETQVGSTAKWPVRESMPRAVSAALDDAAREAVADLASVDDHARRIGDSYLAFRAMLGDARIA